MTLDEAYQEALVAQDWLIEKGYAPWVSVSEWTGGWRVSLLVRTGHKNWLTVGDIVKRSGPRPWYIRYRAQAEQSGHLGPTTSEEVADALTGAQQLHTRVVERVIYGLDPSTPRPTKLKARLLR